jgi:hypothetical protein
MTKLVAADGRTCARCNATRQETGAGASSAVAACVAGSDADARGMLLASVLTCVNPESRSGFNSEPRPGRARHAGPAATEDEAWLND